MQLWPTDEFLLEIFTAWSHVPILATKNLPARLNLLWRNF